MPSLRDILDFAVPVGAQAVGGLVNRRAATSATNNLTSGVQRGMDSLRQGVGQAQDTLQRTYDQQRQDLAPFAGAGTDALKRLQTGVGEGGEFTRNFTGGDFDLFKDPSYQWRVQQGQRAIEAQGNAAGTRFSGATLKALSGYNQESASQEFSNAYERWRRSQQDAFDRTADVAGIGERGTRDLVNAGSDFGRNTAELQKALGDQLAGLELEQANALAAGDLGKAKSVSDAIAGILQTVDRVGTARSMADLVKLGGSVGAAGAGAAASLAGGVAVPSMAAVNSTLDGMASMGMGFAPTAAAPAGAAGGGGAMAAMGAFLTNPITIAAAAAIGIGTLWAKSQAHHEANDWVQHFQNPFDKAMAAINENQQLDPANKAELQKANVVDYLAAAMEFARKKGSDGQQVIRQAMQTLRERYPAFASMAVA